MRADRPAERVASSSQRRGRRVGIYLARLSAGLVVLAVLFRVFDGRTVFETIAGADRSLLVRAWVLAFAGLIGATGVQRVALRSCGVPIPPSTVLKIAYQTRFFGLFMPGGTNLVVKWYKLSRPLGKASSVLGAMGLSRTLLNLALVAFAVAGVWLDARFPWKGLRWAILAFGVLSTVPIGFLVSRRLNRWGGATAKRIWAALPVPGRSRERLEATSLFTEGIRHLRGREIALLLFLLLLTNTAHILKHVHICRAVGIEMDAVAFAWIRGVILVCAMAPFTLAGLGVREASLAGLLLSYGVPEEKTIAYSLLFFAAFVLVEGLIGGALEWIDLLRGGRRGATGGPGET
ncbi:MAG: lysylphosphatidylglycerol synthase transmembrane domain-containing protein [Candidatus Eisenbacteria bacterium]